jgi:hypothetical protein
VLLEVALALDNRPKGNDSSSHPNAKKNGSGNHRITSAKLNSKPSLTNHKGPLLSTHESERSAAVKYVGQKGGGIPLRTVC